MKKPQMSLASTPVIVLVCALLILLFARQVEGQDSGTAKVYRDQFVELHARIRAYLSRAEQQGRNPSTFDPHTAQEVRSTQEMREEILALAKLVHALGEDADRSYLDGFRRSLDSVKSGQNLPGPDKSLLFVQSGCDAMSFIMGSLDNYLETGDRAFLGFAKKGEELASSIEVVL